MSKIHIGPSFALVLWNASDSYAMLAMLWCYALENSAKSELDFSIAMKKSY